MQKESYEEQLNFLAKSSFLIFFGLMTSKIFSYIYRILIARNFGAEAYGLFTLGIIFLTWGGAIAAMGFPQGFVRYLALLFARKKNETFGDLFLWGKRVVLFNAIAIGGLLFFLAPWIATVLFENSSLEMYLRLFALAIPLQVLSEVYASILRGRKQTREYTFTLHAISPVVRVGVIILTLFLVGQLEFVIPLSYVLGIFAAFVVGACFLKRVPVSVSSPPQRAPLELRKEFLRYSLPLLFSLLIVTLLYNLDSFFIGIFLSAEQVGLYNAAVPLALLLTLFPDMLMQMFLPLITREYGLGRRKEVEQLTKQTIKWILLANLFLLIIFLNYPSEIIRMLFGEEFIIVAGVLTILSLAGFFSGVALVFTNLLYMQGKSRTVFSLFLLAAGVNLILNICFIPLYGLMGAAVATLCTWGLFLVVSAVMALSTLRFIPLRRKVLAFFGALIPLQTVIFLLPSPSTTILLLGEIVLEGVVYVAGVILLGGVDKIERKMFLGAGKRLFQGRYKSEVSRRGRTTQ